MRDTTSFLRRRFFPRTILAAAAALALVGAAARAQEPESPGKKIPVEEYVARSITRGALMDLRISPSPTPSDYQIASILLSVAHDLAPEDQDILRRQIEAAHNAGDKQAVLAATRELLKRDPEDTVSQLRLITATILARTQNGEDRSAVYESLLTGPKAGGLDPSVRSRLALDYALLLRDAGDTKGFVQKLILATQLDATNKEAHALAATLFAQQRPDDRLGRLQMLEHLLMADPLDPNTHFAIARELVGGRAFKAARRFHYGGTTILASSAGITDQIRVENFLLLWYTEGPGAACGEMSRDLTATREAARRQILSAEAAKRPTTGMRRPEDVNIPVSLQMPYLLAIDATGDRAATAAALAELVGYYKAQIALITDSVQKQQTTKEQADEIEVQLALQVVAIRLFTGVNVEEAKKDLSTYPTLKAKQPIQAAILEGWAALRSDNAQGAIEMLTPFAEDNPNAELGIAVAYEQLGRKEEAIRHLDRVVRAAPLDVAGAWAWSRLEKLGYQEETKAIAELESFVAGIDKSIGAEMVQNPGGFLQLSAALENPAPEGLDRTVIYVTLQNTAPFPMALGPNRAISSRFLIAPKMDNFNLGPLSMTIPEVADLDRRLRLMPNEKLRVKLWPDVGQTGWLLDALANRSVRVRWRLIQGFIPDRGSYRPGPMCLSTETESVVRRPLPESSITPDGLAKHFAGDPPDALVRLAAAARANAVQQLLIPAMGAWPANKPGEAPGVDEPLKPAAEAIAKRYPTLAPVMRAMLAVVLPHAKLAPGLAAVDRAIAADADPMVLCIALAFRVSDAADPILATARASDDPRVRQLADLIAERLTRNDLIFARLTAKQLLEGDKPAAPGAGK